MKFIGCILVVVTLPAAGADDYAWNLPKGFPRPHVPADNPMTAAKVELGRYLFYDTRMSSNQKSSCASCHKQERAFTDGLPVSVGTTGEHHPRNAMSLVNIAYSAVLTWANPQLHLLEQQAVTPMFGEHPVELGLREGDGFLPAIESDARYRAMFARAFPGEAHAFTMDNAVKAIACFERTIISARSPYDRYHYGGDDHAVSDAAKRGEILFFSAPLSCFRCHGGFNFSDATGSPERPVEFHNTGLYNPYPAPNTGIFEYTKNPADAGKFKTPTLRNIAVTAPYMHDGSVATLADVLNHYAAGGRSHDHPNKDPLVGGFKMSERDRADLIAFLESLTDEEVLHDPRFANPFQ